MKTKGGQQGRAYFSGWGGDRAEGRAGDAPSGAVQEPNACPLEQMDGGAREIGVPHLRA